MDFKMSAIRQSFCSGLNNYFSILWLNPHCIGHDYKAYMDYIDLDVHYPRKAIKLNHSLTHWITLVMEMMICQHRQAIIWTNANPIHWCIYAALGGDELSLIKH